MKKAEAAAMIEKLTAELKTMKEENETLRGHCEAQDYKRRVAATEHSEEMRQVLGEIQTVKAILGARP